MALLEAHGAEPATIRLYDAAWTVALAGLPSLIVLLEKLGITQSFGIVGPRAPADEDPYLRKCRPPSVLTVARRNTLMRFLGLLAFMPLFSLVPVIGEKATSGDFGFLFL